MKRFGLTSLLGLFMVVCLAQNLELRNGKDLKQPGKINPALAGVQEDFVRVLTDAEIGNSYQLMLDGKIPLKLGNYMVGFERLYTDNVQDNMFNITYGNTIGAKKKKLLEKKKDFQFRYGASVKIHTKNLINTGYDSSSGYNFVDINGQTKNVGSLDQLSESIKYFNVELGAGFQYKNLFGSLGVDNLLTPNVSLVDTATRKLPISGNLLVGGFLNAGEKFTIFPSVLVEYNEEYAYSKISIDAASEMLTLQASYIMENDVLTSQNISGSIGYRYNKNALIGLRYTHPLENDLIDALPRFNLYINVSLLKRPDMFMGGLGKQLSKFY